MSFIAQCSGSYVLLIRLLEGQTITVGRLGDIYFPHGCYAYVGSAMGGVKSRLSHHLRSGKRLHWHIDYLLQKASIIDIIIYQTGDRAECTIAWALSSQFDCIPGFGSSDCRCHSHLFFAAEERQMKATIRATLESLAVMLELTGAT